MPANDKQELIEALDASQHDPVAEWEFLFIVIISIMIILMLTLPKIYLRNSIYYESRAIDRLETQYEALIEENKLLSRKVEEIKVKNQILDTLF
ncbi:hypothetical protein [Hydrogenimonas thermophila]|uniref:Uncharacterized protein n=1 Tax=Hydrogenimonas thermophila TaxID=223786 RepID=A0A1I5QMB6_9BACT|nr:hypothetical protein [Hydrogenimonas thermophila]WOE71158.1 hypothetical protein RZR91_06175 [Hydrogenimonas thermophila]WOE73676.1 hypothetical protein RZR97_06150 [Hydrogenimonas thermophila]SFP47403.1 hypothetical protein SAMN05216234_12112 [Hydrogenimonas thermophila]